MPDAGSTLGHAAARRKQLNNILDRNTSRPRAFIIDEVVERVGQDAVELSNLENMPDEEEA